MLVMSRNKPPDVAPADAVAFGQLLQRSRAAVTSSSSHARPRAITVTVGGLATCFMVETPRAFLAMTGFIFLALLGRSP
jgi:hypothetical protein